MESIRILAYSLTLVFGTVLLAGSIHYFRCNSKDSFQFQYSNESVLIHYCPSVPEAEAVKDIVEIYEQYGDYSDDDIVYNSTLPVKLINQRLGKHDVYLDKITLSGFSSGGTFAQQLFIANSALFSGIASFSHAYYRCGPGTGSEAEYDDACTIVGANTTYNLDNALEDIRSYEERGLIDNTEHIRNKKLYIYAGTRSNLFRLEQSLGAISVFGPLIQNPRNIFTRVQNAHQLLPSDRYGGQCTRSAEGNFFIGNCGLLGSADALGFLLHGENIRFPGLHVRPKLQQLLTFDQTEFFFGYSGPEYMDSHGFIYVPRHCHRQRCYLHFYFHGCRSGREFNGTDHIVNSGFLELAEVNNLIVVFPQAWSSRPENMIGCWDVYGLTGQLYATRRAAQITVVRNMIARILGMDNDNEIVPVADREPGVGVREREPLGIEFEIVKGREVYL